MDVHVVVETRLHEFLILVSDILEQNSEGPGIDYLSLRKVL